MDETEKRVPLTVRLDPKLKARFKSLTALEQISMNDLLEDFVKQWVDEAEKRQKNSP